jgi:cold shock CspA family protein
LDTRCSISVVVNAARWQSDGDMLAECSVLPQRWSLTGLKDYVRLVVGSALGRTFEQIDLVDLRFCRSLPCDVDAEAAASEFSILTTSHVTIEDSGAGLSLEAIDSVNATSPNVVVMVGGMTQWTPLRQKLDSLGIELFELLLLPAGKTQVSSARVLDLREKVRRGADVSPESALSAPAILPKKAASSQKVLDPAEQSSDKAANAVLGVVKLMAKGYGVVTRKDGLGDIEFLAAHVAPPGFQFIEVGDTVRFDVIQLPGGKWQAKRVSRM